MTKSIQGGARIEVCTLSGHTTLRASAYHLVFGRSTVDYLMVYKLDLFLTEFCARQDLLAQDSNQQYHREIVKQDHRRHMFTSKSMNNLTGMSDIGTK